MNLVSFGHTSDWLQDKLIEPKEFSGKGPDRMSFVGRLLQDKRDVVSFASRVY